MLALTLVLCFLAPEIGANYNHDPELIEMKTLRRVPVEWVRTTPYAFEYLRGVKEPGTSPGLNNVIAAKKAGYKVAFGLRWDFRKNNTRIPAHGSPFEKECFDVTERMLDRVGSSIDIFTLGNEPILETLDADMQPESPSGQVPLVRFTARLLKEVVDPWYARHAESKRPQVYVGSLPRLFFPETQKSPAVLGLIQVAQDDPSIAGLAIHLHLETEAQIAQAFEFVRARMPKKPVIVPEFSFHTLYVKHLGESLGADAAGEAFAARYRRDPNMPLFEWYSLANQHRVQADEWAAMFASRSWFPQRALLTFDRYFERYGVVLATYGFVSQYAPARVPANGMAWFVNPVFPFKSLPDTADGSYAANPLWFDDFVKIVQRGRGSSGKVE